MVGRIIIALGIDCVPGATNESDMSNVCRLAVEQTTTVINFLEGKGPLCFWCDAF